MNTARCSPTRVHIATTLALAVMGMTQISRAVVPVQIIKTDATWKTTDTLPPSGWETTVGFNDSAWIPAFKSPGGDNIWYGSNESASSPDQAWFRQTFTLSAPVSSAIGNFFFDDNGQDYLNGHLLINDTGGGATSFSNVIIDPTWFVVGVNLFAIHGVNTEAPFNNVGANIQIATVPVVKENNLNPLNLNTSWVGGASQPGPSDVAIFNNVFSSPAPLTLGADLNWGGIQLLNPGGAVSITGANVLTLGSGGIDMSAATQDLSFSGGTVSLSAVETFSVAAGRTLTFSEPVVSTNALTVVGAGNTTFAGGLSNVPGLSKSGSGTLTFTGPASLVTNMTLTSGTVLLNFAGTSAPLTNQLAGFNTLVLGGASLQMVGANGFANSQTLVTTNLFSGANNVTVTNGAGGSAVLAMGTLARTPGAVITFNGPANGSLTLTFGSGVSGAFGGLLQGVSSIGNRAAFALYGLNDYAALGSGSTIIPGSSVPNFYTPSSSAIGAGVQNVNLDIVSSSVNTPSAAAVNVIRFNNPAFNSLSLINNLGTGGILVTPNMGAVNTTISGNVDMSPGTDATPSEMVIVQNNTGGFLNIATNLNDGGSTGDRFTFAGRGTTQLTGTNNMRGITTLDDGFVVATSNNSLGNVTTGAGITIVGGALVANPAGTTLALNNAGSNSRNIVLGNGVAGSNGGTLAALDSKVLVVSGIVSGVGPLSIGMGTLPGTGPGTANPVALTGTGTVSLTGNSNTFSSPVTVTFGTLDVAGSSATGTGDVTVNSGTTLRGAGSIAGSTTVAGGAHIQPGNGVGTLGVHNLTLSAGAVLDYEFSGGFNDTINFLGTSTLSLASAVTLNLVNFGTNSPFGSSGNYTLFSNIGPIVGDLSNLVIGNPVATASYNIFVTGSIVQLSIINSGDVGNFWNVNSGGAWGNAANWSNHVPNTAGDAANFLGAVTTGTAIITLDTNRTVRAVVFNSAAHYEIATGAPGGSLILDNGTTSIAPSITNFAGSHKISAPILLNSALGASIALNTGTVTLSGIISGASGNNVAVTGPGTLVLAGANTYAGNTSIAQESTLQLDNGGNFGSGSVSISGNLRLNHSDTFTLSNVLTGSGTLIQAGTGNAILGAVSPRNGLTSITAGTLSLAPGASFGTGPLDVSAGKLDLAGNPVSTVFLTGAGVIGNSSAFPATLTIAGGTFAGSIAQTSGALSLIKTTSSSVTLNGSASNYTGTTTISLGTLTIGTGAIINGGAFNTPSGGNPDNNTAGPLARLVVSGGTLTASASSNIGTGGNGSGLLVSSGIARFNGGLTTDQLVNQPNLIAVTGGTLIASSLTLGRTSLNFPTQPTAGSTTQGLYINGGTALITGNLGMGLVSGANSSPNIRIDAGSLTVGGTLTIGVNSVGRWAVVDVGAGSLNVNDPSGNSAISLGGPFSSLAILLVHGSGIATATKITLGQASNAGTSAISLTDTGKLFIGTGGIVKISPSVTTSISLAGGTLGAAGDWSSSEPMTLSGAIIQTADAANIAHNITLSGNLSGTAGINKAGSGTLILSGSNNYAAPTAVNAGKVIVTTGASIPSNGSVTLAAGTNLSLTNGMNAIKISALTIAGTSTVPTASIDLKNSGMALTYTSGGAALTTASYQRVIAARGIPNSGVSDYSGKGITSSTAATNNQAAAFDKFGVGLINNADLSTIGLNPAYTTFLGVTGLTANTVLARYTYMGDINLDGKINIDDYNYIDAGFGGLLAGVSGQIKGDFNNDGLINIDDYNVIDAGFGFQGSPLGGSGDLSPLIVPAPSGDAAFPGLSPVPEPATALLLLPAGISLLMQRRKHLPRPSTR